METAILKCTNVYTSSTSIPNHHPLKLSTTTPFSHKIYELQGGVGVPLHKIFVHVHQNDSMKAKQTLGYKIKGRWVRDGEGCLAAMVAPMCTI